MEGERRTSKRHQKCMSHQETGTTEHGNSRNPRRNLSEDVTKTTRSLSHDSRRTARSVDEGTSGIPLPKKQTFSSRSTTSGGSSNVPSRKNSLHSDDQRHSRLNTTVLCSQPNRRKCNHTCPCDCEEINENVFYFVVPPHTTRDTVSAMMEAAYKECTARDFSITWLEDEDVHGRQLVRGAVFVLDKFEGAGYKIMATKLAERLDFMIIGPNVLNYMFHRNVLEYIKLTAFPIFTLAMKDVIVSTTNIRDPEKQEIVDLIHLMGGKFESKYTTTVTHVIASSVLSDKAVTAKRKKTPLMTTHWVRAVWAKSQLELVHSSDEEFSSYEAPMFLNVNVCFSQITTQQKARLQELIKKNGGTHSADLIRKSTNVLIVPKPDGDKYRHAKAWDIHCLSPDWIMESINAGYALHTEKFKITVPDHPFSSTLAADGTRPHHPDINLSCSIITGNNTKVINASHVSNSTGGDSTIVNAGNMHMVDMSCQLQPQVETHDPFIPVDVIEIDDEDDSSVAAEAEVTSVPVPAVVKSIEENKSKSSGVSEVSSHHHEHEPTDTGMQERTSGMEHEHIGNHEPNVITPEPIESVFYRRRFYLILDDDLVVKTRTLELIEAIGGLVVIGKPFDFVITLPVLRDEPISDCNHYTEHWLDDCYEANSVQIQQEFYHYPVLACSEVKGLFDSIVLAVSSYGFPERTYICGLATYMGAIVQDVFAKKTKGQILATTHLVCSNVDNPKTDAAVRWKLPVVTCEWILKCYAKKRVLDTAPFNPAVQNRSENESRTETSIAEVASMVTMVPARGSNLNGDNKSGNKGTLNPEPIPVNNVTTTAVTMVRPRVSSTGSNTSSNDPATHTPVNPRVQALGEPSSSRKSSLGLSPLTQEPPVAPVVSSPFGYIYPTLEEMYEEAQEAQAMTIAAIKARMPPRPSPQTPKLRQEWLQHLRDTWLQPRNLQTAGDLEMDSDPEELPEPESQIRALPETSDMSLFDVDDPLGERA